MDSWLDAPAHRQPDRPALEGPGRSLTYAELRAAAGGVAAGLRSQGVNGGAGIALQLEDRIEFVVALHACLLLGAPAVPVDLRLSEPERAVRRRLARTVLAELPPAGDGGWASEEVDEQAVATVMHTSGTTAEPKPVKL